MAKLFLGSDKIHTFFFHLLMEKDISLKFTITEKILLVNIICYNPTLLHFEFANVRIESDMFAV